MARVYKNNKYTEFTIKTYTIIIIIDAWKCWIMILNMTVTILSDGFNSSDNFNLFQTN